MSAGDCVQVGQEVPPAPWVKGGQDGYSITKYEIEHRATHVVVEPNAIWWERDMSSRKVAIFSSLLHECRHALVSKYACIEKCGATDYIDDTSRVLGPPDTRMFGFGSQLSSRSSLASILKRTSTWRSFIECLRCISPLLECRTMASGCIWRRSCPPSSSLSYCWSC